LIAQRSHTLNADGFTLKPAPLPENAGGQILSVYLNINPAFTNFEFA
jgi:hypothetical protein